MAGEEPAVVLATLGEVVLAAGMEVAERVPPAKVAVAVVMAEVVVVAGMAVAVPVVPYVLFGGLLPGCVHFLLRIRAIFNGIIYQIS
jgi:hypothetical protein